MPRTSRARLFAAAALAVGLAAAAPAFAQTAPAHPAGDDMPARAGMDMGDRPAGHGMMDSPFGDYLMMRDASGTSWQPDASPHAGIMTMTGDWTVMAHALVNVVYDNQGGPRGGDKTFVGGMAMVMAQRPLGGGVVGLRAMLSPDPAMGPSGYPLLLATGETANGTTPLIDRQHPHDLFMELSASYSHPLGDKVGVYLYAGLPGEPAFGPPAFMHRDSGLDSPEAPISHHWLDSTHITFGVVTAGLVFGDAKIEASGFRGREPDQHRWDIEAPKLDSWSVRGSYNPGPQWSLQASYAHITSPEQLDPDTGEDRFSASAIYTRRVGAEGEWSTTLAYGRKWLRPGPSLDAVLLESALRPDDRWTFFARAERVEESELAPGVHTVGKLSAGVIRDVRVAEHLKIGLGGLVSGYALPATLKPSYGSPVSGMVFLRFKLD